MEEKTTKQNPDAKPKGPSKREKIITGCLGIAFVVAALIAGIISMRNGQ